MELLQTGWSRQIANWADALSKVFEDESTEAFEALSRSVVERSEPDHTREPLQGEFWLYAARNPDAMAIFADKLREQHDRFEPTIEAAMQREGTPPGISPEEMTTVALVLLPGLAGFGGSTRTAFPTTSSPACCGVYSGSNRHRRAAGRPRPEIEPRPLSPNSQLTNGGDEGPAVDAVASVVAVEVRRPGQWE